ncbi:MAG: HAD family phosphatase [Bacteroidales bacterium]|nr:HAD family phosphatase [Bacteroidales bacterium]
MATFWTKRNEDVEDEKTVSPWSKQVANGDKNFPKRRRIKAALFDLDGTLVDTEDQYTVFWGSMARKYRPDVPRLEYLIKGTTLTQIFDTYFPDPQWQAEITEGLNQWEAEMRYDFYPGALSFLEDLKRNDVMCAVVTSSNIPKINSVRKQITHFDSLFDKVLTAEDFSASKPAPDCYLLGAKVFNADIDECVVFEDAYTGLQAGMSSGIFTFGLTTGHTREEITNKCNYVLEGFEGMSFGKLTEILDKFSF